MPNNWTRKNCLREQQTVLLAIEKMEKDLDANWVDAFARYERITETTNQIQNKVSRFVQLIDGNGSPPLGERIASLERWRNREESQKQERHSFWNSVRGGVGTRLISMIIPSLLWFLLIGAVVSFWGKPFLVEYVNEVINNAIEQRK